MVWSSGFRLWISNPEKAGFEKAVCHLRVVSIKWPAVIVTGHKPYNGHILKVVISESFILPKAAHTQRHFTYSTCGTTVQSFVVCISKIFPLGISQPYSIWWILKHSSIRRGFFSILTIVHGVQNCILHPNDWQIYLMLKSRPCLTQLFFIQSINWIISFTSRT